MKKIIALIFMITSISTKSQTIIPLYNGNIPNYISSPKQEINYGNGRIAGIAIPQIIIFLPQKPDSAKSAVIICPGGGYARLAIEHEGYEVARTLNAHGIAAFILKYRIPNDSFMTNKQIVPLQDAERAIQLIREKAVEWNVNQNKIGIMGFSAGGHLASTLGTHFNEVVIENSKNTSLRPDFLILGYPVISFDKTIAHMGSRNNLIGKDPSQELSEHFSNELQVTAQTPITFIVHASDDATVPVENSVRFYQALQKNKVPAEIHIYEKGGHGFGLHNKTTTDEWFESLIHWMMMNKFIRG
jgi:acetyl esterase/lipase